MSNLQNKLDLMKGWSAKRLAAAVPAWARCKMLPPYRGPQLSQIFKHHGATMPKSAPHPQVDFACMPHDATVQEYVEAWDERQHYVPGATVWAQPHQEERIAA